MPFTITHTLAVVPIAFAFPRRLAFSALAIGSMIPDLPMFLPLVIRPEFTHSLFGLSVICLPLGMASFLLFQLFMKEPLANLLSNRLRQRLTPYCEPRVDPSVSFFVWTAVAIFLGGATHVVWDAFTHEGRWGV